MQAPLVNLFIFASMCVAAAVLFWPRRGIVVRRRGESLERVLVEDTLKHLYHNGEQTLTQVADALRVSGERALRIVDRMQRGELIELCEEKFGLTSEGLAYALQIIRAHRLWERHLADETGHDPVEWHARAERREHSITREEADDLAARLGYPRFDPHGDPIPTSDGVLRETETLALPQLDSGDAATIVHLEDEPAVVYAQLMALGVYVGMILRIEAKTEGRLVLAADGRSIILAPVVAGNISVRRLEPFESEELESAETLASLQPGDTAEVVRISQKCRGVERRRLMDLGVVPGTSIQFERRGLTGGLTAYRVRGTVIGLREEQTTMIAIRPSKEVAS